MRLLTNYLYLPLLSAYIIEQEGILDGINRISLEAHSEQRDRATDLPTISVRG
jgi:hypothetical protein